MTLYQIRLEWKTFSVTDCCIFWHLKEINNYYYYMLQCHTCIFKTRYCATCKNTAFRVLGLKNNEEKNNKSDLTELELKLQMFKGDLKEFLPIHTHINS